MEYAVLSASLNYLQVTNTNISIFLIKNTYNRNLPRTKCALHSLVYFDGCQFFQCMAVIHFCLLFMTFGI